MLIETLQQYWLTEKEAKVYLAGISLWSAPWGTIARHTWENRTTVYSILKELVKQGIFTVIERQWISYFSPISPDILVRNIEDKYNAIKDKLPEFMALVDKSNNKPKVQFFEWVEGVKKAFQVILDESNNTNHDYIRAFQWEFGMDIHIKKYLKETFSKIRKNYPIKSKVIISGENSTYNEHNPWVSEYIKIQDPIFNLANEIVLYNKTKVAILLYNEDEKSACIIESVTLFEAMRSMFDILRKTLGTKPRKIWKK